MSARRDASKAYKERQRIGGVYTITNSVNGRYLIGHAADLASVRNRFQFAITTGSAVDPRVRGDWMKDGAQAFRLDVREELEQRADQSEAEFMADLQALEQMVCASLDPALSY